MVKEKEVEEIFGRLYPSKYDYAIIGGTIGIWAKTSNPNFGYNISGYVIELFKRNGFEISFVTLNQDRIPRVEFIRDLTKL